MTKLPLCNLTCQNAIGISYINENELICDYRGHIDLKQPRNLSQNSSPRRPILPNLAKTGLQILLIAAAFLLEQIQKAIEIPVLLAQYTYFQTLCRLKFCIKSTKNNILIFCFIKTFTNFVGGMISFRPCSLYHIILLIKV